MNTRMHARKHSRMHLLHRCKTAFVWGIWGRTQSHIHGLLHFIQHRHQQRKTQTHTCTCTCTLSQTLLSPSLQSLLIKFSFQSSNPSGVQCFARGAAADRLFGAHFFNFPGIKKNKKCSIFWRNQTLDKTKTELHLNPHRRAWPQISRESPGYSRRVSMQQTHLQGTFGPQKSKGI